MLIFLLVLLQSTVLKTNLLLLFVIFQASYAWAFWAGLILDLFSHQPLGLSSLLFLMIVHLFKLYSRKYEPRFGFLLPFVFLTGWVFAKVEKQSWSLGQGLLLGLLTLPLRKHFNQENQLKLDI